MTSCLCLHLFFLQKDTKKAKLEKFSNGFFLPMSAQRPLLNHVFDVIFYCHTYATMHVVYILSAVDVVTPEFYPPFKQN